MIPGGDAPRFAEEIAMEESGKRALWTKLVADFELSGQSQRAFAEARQVELSNLR